MEACDLGYFVPSFEPSERESGTIHSVVALEGTEGVARLSVDPATSNFGANASTNSTHCR